MIGKQISDHEPVRLAALRLQIFEIALFNRILHTPRCSRPVEPQFFRDFFYRRRSLFASNALSGLVLRLQI